MIAITNNTVVFGCNHGSQHLWLQLLELVGHHVKQSCIYLAHNACSLLKPDKTVGLNSKTEDLVKVTAPCIYTLHIYIGMEFLQSVHVAIVRILFPGHAWRAFLYVLSPWELKMEPSVTRYHILNFGRCSVYLVLVHLHVTSLDMSSEFWHLTFHDLTYRDCKIEHTSCAIGRCLWFLSSQNWSGNQDDNALLSHICSLMLWWHRQHDQNVKFQLVLSFSEVLPLFFTSSISLFWYYWPSTGG